MQITIRDVTPNDAHALAHILITAEEHTFRGLVPDKCLEFTEAESAANWQKFFQKGLPVEDVFVAAETPSKQIIAYAWGVPNQKDQVFGGELRQIHVLPTFHGRGIGRRLVVYVAQKLASRGIHSLRVDVLAVNPNRAFYTHLGATFVGEYPYDWDGVTLTSHIYGWEDTYTLRT